jgi:arabinofuranosyltransferase
MERPKQPEIQGRPTAEPGGWQPVEPREASGLRAAPLLRLASRREAAAMALVGIALALYGVVVVRTAWLSDDAYITLRTVDNFVSGFGLRWNVDERVQSYTHPLWLMLISSLYALTHEAYYTLVFLSLGVSVLALLVLCRRAATWPAALLAVVLLTTSKAFVDYSTSGLENPLAHLLLLLLWGLYVQAGEQSARRVWTLAFLGSLVAVTRLDLVLLVVPPFLHAAWCATRERRLLWWIRSTALGLMPLFLWELFSIIYYGFPLPNTAYAKLDNSGQSAAALMSQGLYYVRHSLRSDPVALCALVGAAAAVVWRRRPHLVAVTVGIVLYGLYIVRIGGDFMIGRFLTVCVLGAVFVLSQIAWSFRTAFVASTAILIASLLAVPQTPLRATPEDRVAPGGGYQAHRGVADERAYYAARNGLLSRHRSAPRHGWVGRRDTRARCVLPRESSGVAAFTAGPAVHVIDQLALSEPLLARLPARAVIFFRVGHVDRGVPPGYVETLATGRVAICDPTLARYYERLHVVISGPLFTRDRFEAIWQLNTGQLNHLRDRYVPQPPCATADDAVGACGF